MPQAQIGHGALRALRRMIHKPFTHRPILGWPVPSVYVHRLVQMGYAEVYYDMADEKTKARATAVGIVREGKETARAHLVMEAR